MESIIRLNHRSNTQLQDIVNQINAMIGARVIDTYNSETSHNSRKNQSTKERLLSQITQDMNATGFKIIVERELAD